MRIVAASLLVPALAFADASAPAVTVDRDKLQLCTDGKSHYVAIGPHERVSTQLYYGDAKKLVEVDPRSGGMLSGNDFEDPRFYNKTANPHFRGLDIRIFSSFEFDAEKKTCKLRCGDRTATWTYVEPAQAKPLVAQAEFAPSPRAQEPYALARDERGVYYYVDHGVRPETAKSFRLFVGQKGALKLQKMTNVVSDSEGDIFSTKSGSLRMILGKPESLWIEGKKSTKLLPVPVADNLPMIYTELGVYTGVRLGTPCDDF